MNIEGTGDLSLMSGYRRCQAACCALRMSPFDTALCCKLPRYGGTVIPCLLITEPYGTRQVPLYLQPPAAAPQKYITQV
jgi:hypothetical protein